VMDTNPRPSLSGQIWGFAVTLSVTNIGNRRRRRSGRSGLESEGDRFGSASSGVTGEQWLYDIRI
jgi:hypothetical protein